LDDTGQLLNAFGVYLLVAYFRILREPVLRKAWKVVQSIRVKSGSLSVGFEKNVRRVVLIRKGM
jgi:hypothetical protein